MSKEGIENTTLEAIELENDEERLEYFKRQPETKPLTDPLLFKKITEIELDKKIVREEEARKTIFLIACGGRLVRNAEPTSKNLMINDLSGAGKDYIIKQVLGLIKEEHKIIRKRISPKAFTYWKNAYYEPEWTWDGKVFYNEDISNSVLNSDVFKVMASSDGVNESTIVIRNNAYDIKVIGKPVMLITIANAKPNIENLRRFPICNIDTTEEQTKLILKRKAEFHKKGIKPEYDQRVINSLDNLVRIKVKVPFADKLVDLLSTKHVIVRTNFDRFVDYIKFSTAIHQYQRKRDDEDYFIAEGQDYNIGRLAFIKTTSNILSIPLTKDQQEILDVFRRLKEEENLFWSASEVEKYFTFSKPTLYEQLDILTRYGFLEKEREERENSSKRVMVWRYLDLVKIELPTWEELQNG